MVRKVSFSILVLCCVTVAQSQKTDFDEFRTGLPSNLPDATLRDFWDHRSNFAVWVTERMSDRAGKPPFDRAYIDCGTCRAAVKIALDMLQIGMPPEAIENSVIFMCKALGIITDEECELLIHLIAPPILHVLVERKYLRVDDFCGIMLQEEHCGEVLENLTNWTIDLDENKPALPVETPLLPDTTPTTKIIQFTDVHLNLRDTNCDPCPMSAIEATFKHAREQHGDARYIFLTGDFVDETFTTNETQNIQHFETIAQWLFKYFPATPLIPVIGNHEAHPWNLFPPRSVWNNFDLSWMYDSLWRSYGGWIPRNQEETFRRGGFYTMRAESGLRFVVINNNLCYIYNFWLPYDTVDPEGQLQWLADTLLNAELAQEKVILIGHLSPGLDDCWWPWNAWYNRIIDRFQNILVAQFHGHTHKDQFKIYFDDSDSEEPKPTGSLYIGAPSVPYGENPGYKVYYLDGIRSGRTWEILNHETYHADLSGNGDPVFEKMYSARNAYNLPSLRPSDLYDFVIEMGRNDTLFQLYHRHYYVAYRESSIPRCDTFACKMRHLCDIVTSTTEDSSHCDRLHAILNGTITYKN